MPGYDQTGPQGLGPLTGRRMGICIEGVTRLHKGFGRFGFGRRFLVLDNESLSKAEEKDLLKEDLKELEAEIKEIERRLKELD